MRVLDREPLRVLHVSGLRRYGGIFTFIRELVAYQKEQQGLDVEVLSVLTGAEPFEQQIRRYAPTIEGGSPSGWDVNLRRYRRLLDVMSRYDVLHFHGFHPLVAAAGYFSRTPIVHTEHGTFQRANLSGTPAAYFRKRMLGYPFLEHGTEAVVFISHWLKRDVGLHKSGCYVIHNGKTASVPLPQRSAAIHGEFRVLTVGRFEARKKIDRLVRAFALLPPAHAMRLEMVGDGSHEKELEALAQRMIPAGRFTFHGFQSSVDSFYQNAHVFVLPAEREPFGLVAVEAMLFGLPVICFQDGGGTLEIVGGIHPRLVVRDERELSEALIYWKENPADRVAVGMRLYERATSYFTMERMASEYLSVYEQVIDGRARRKTLWPKRGESIHVEGVFF